MDVLVYLLPETDPVTLNNVDKIVRQPDGVSFVRDGIGGQSPVEVARFSDRIVGWARKEAVKKTAD